MEDYKLIKNVIYYLVDDTYGGDPSTHASVVSEEIDASRNDYSPHMNYDIIAAVALKEGYNVYRVKHGYYGDKDYLILKRGYTLDKYAEVWKAEMPDVDEVLEGAYQVKSLDDIVKPD